jgi:FtsH-binding integral membrane protein
LVVAYICAAVNNPRIVVSAAFMTATLVLSLTVYAYFTNTDFTVMGGLAFILLGLFIILGLFSFLFGPKLYLVYCFVGVLLFGFYLIIDTQMIIGNNNYELDKDDYIMGAMILYLDIINMFLYLLQIFSSLCKE